MKDGIHPEYRDVIFHDASSGSSFLMRSTIKTSLKSKWEDGNEYPLVNVDISAASHPFYTGKAKYVDAAGRIDKFRQKFGGKYGQKAKAGAKEG